MAPEKTAPLKTDTLATTAPLAVSERSGALQPRQIKTALDALSAGDFTAAAPIFDEMEDKDYHLASVMQTRVAAVTGLPMSIVPGADDTSAKAIALDVETMWNAIPEKEKSLGQLLLSGLGHGVGFAEIEWVLIDGTLKVKRLHVRDTRNLNYRDEKNDGDLLDFPIWRGKGDDKGKKIDPASFIHFTPFAGKRHAVRSGLYRGLAWLWLFGNYTLKDWLSFNEIYGKALRLGKYGSNSDDAAKEALRDAVKRLGSDAAAVIDADSKIEFIEAKTKGDVPYLKTVQYFNSEKSKRVLGQTLTTEQGNSGARALGEVHDKVRLNIRAADARALETVISHDLIKRYVDYNYGAQENYPTLTIQTDDPTTVNKALESAKKMQELGFATSESYLRKLTGLPAPAEEENTKINSGPRAADKNTQRPVADSAPPTFTPLTSGNALDTAIADTAPFVGSGPEQKEMVANSRSYIAGDGAADALAKAALYRPATLLAYGAIVDAIAARFTAAGKPRALADDDSSLLALAAQIEKGLVTGHLLGVGSVLAEAQAEEELYTPVAEIATNELLLNDAPRIGFVDLPTTVMPPEEAAAWWENKLVATASDYAAMSATQKQRAFWIAKLEDKRIATRIHALFQKALTDEASSNLSFSGWYAETKKIAPDIFMSPAYAETVFYSNIQTAFQVARYKTFTADDPSGFVAKAMPNLRLVVVHDKNTSVTCGDLAARNIVLPRDDPWWKTHWPPFHFRCRTTVAGVSRHSERVVTARPVGVEWTKGWEKNPAVNYSTDLHTLYAAPQK